MDRAALTDDVSLSRIVYGMWRLTDDPDRSASHIRAKIDACLAQGITTLDQADIYGGYTAEAALGPVFAADPGLRDRVEIVGKCGIVAPMGRYADRGAKHYDTSAAHVTAAVEQSLRDMATDRLDLLLIHRPDPFMDPEDTGKALDSLVKSGKVRAVGTSNFRPWDWELLQSAMATRLCVNQIEISLSRLSPFTDGDLAFHQRQGHRVMAWSPLGGGGLMGDAGPVGAALDAIAADRGVDRAAVAVAFLLAHPAGIVPVMGTNTLSRIGRLGEAAHVALTRQEWFTLYTAALGAEVP